MLLWIIMALMTGAAVLSALCPLSRKMSAVSDEATDVSFYDDQISDIARDVGRGAMTDAAANAARAEAGRRLLRAREAAPQALSVTGEPALRRRRAASAFALSVVPIVSLAIYGAVGSPSLASLPAQQSLPAAGSVDLDAALGQIQSHLALHPDDLRGWDLVAPIYLRVGRPADAATAYEQALRVGGDTLDRLTGYGEALVTAANGIVAPAATSAFARALKLDPGSPKARFFVALAAEQDGDLAKAQADYAAIVRSSPADAPWLPLVQARLSALTGDAPPNAAPATLASPPPEILAMVSSLDARLRASGGDEAEWSRLIRSYVVLGRRDEAADRLAQARTALAPTPGAGERLDHLASDLGLSGDRK